MFDLFLILLSVILHLAVFFSLGLLTEKLRGELADAMAMCGVHSLAEISGDLLAK